MNPMISLRGESKFVLLLQLRNDSLRSRAGSPGSGHPPGGPPDTSDSGVSRGTGGHSPWGGMPLLVTDLVPEVGCGFTKSLGNLMLVASARDEVIF